MRDIILLAMVFVPSLSISLLQVGHVVTFTLQSLQVMCPTGQAGIGTSLGMRRHTGHWNSSETSDIGPSEASQNWLVVPAGILFIFLHWLKMVTTNLNMSEIRWKLRILGAYSKSVDKEPAD